MKFDYIVGNPPFGTREHTNLDVKCLNHIINNGNKIIWIMPFSIASYFCISVPPKKLTTL